MVINEILRRTPVGDRDRLMADAVHGRDRASCTRQRSPADRRHGIALRVACDVPSIFNLLTPTRLDGEFEIHHTRGQAVALSRPRLVPISASDSDGPVPPPPFRLTALAGDLDTG